MSFAEPSKTSTPDKVAIEVRGVEVTYPNGCRAIRGVNLTISTGVHMALVGESGSGKTTLAYLILGLLPRGTTVTGSVRIAGQEIVGMREASLRALRGKKVGFVAQDPMRAFDPLMRVGRSVAEAWRVQGIRPPRNGVRDRLQRYGIVEAVRRMRWHPHMWSGGMLQRAAIAAAVAHSPTVIVADEPTSALDADRADSVLSAFRETGSAVLLISHDLRLVARHSDEVAIMYAGRVVEVGAASQVLARPRHPYTAALLAATPQAGKGLPFALPGFPPRLDRPLSGCAFAPRCSRVISECMSTDPALINGVACLRAQ